MEGLDVKIVTPMGVTYTQDGVKTITVTTQEGEITVHPRHVPMISLLAPGEMTVRTKDANLYLAVAHGVLEVRKDNNIIILADRAEHAEEIDFIRAQEAKDRAERKLRETSLTPKQASQYEQLLEKEENRLVVATRHKERNEVE